METSITQGTVQVDGASIYYERRGDGPAVLLVSPGQGEAANFARVADLLADDYTVLTLDRRGVGRSQWQGPSRPYNLLQHAQDAVAVIKANGFESAAVAGCSSGASIVLELVAAYPEAVGRAVSHEPPVITGLPDRAELLDYCDSLEAMAEDGQPGQAYAGHIRRVGLADLMPAPAGPPSPEMLENLKRFMTDTAPATNYYRPNYARLREAKDRLVIAYGRDGLSGLGVEEPGKAIFTVRTAQAVAQRLGMEAVEFPGNHILPITDPAAFAAALRPLL